MSHLIRGTSESFNCNQRSPLVTCSTLLKISCIVFGLLVIGSAIASHIYQVNALAVYTMGAIGGFIILATVIASIVRCRGAEKSPSRAQQKSHFRPISAHQLVPAIPNASPDSLETKQNEEEASDGSRIRQYGEKRVWVEPNAYHLRAKMAQDVHDLSNGERRQTISQVRGFCNAEVAIQDVETVERQEWDGSQGIRGHGVSYHYRIEARPVERSFLGSIQERVRSITRPMLG